MKMEPLSSGRLKIWMTESDMHYWGLVFDRMDARDIATRRAVLRLISIARQRLFLPLRDELTIEALPLRDGCLLLLTPTRSFLPKTPSVYAIHHANDLLQLGDTLARLSPRAFPAASLFGWKNEYRLILYPDATIRLREDLLGEFAEPIPVGHAYIEEHGTPLIIGTALQRLLTVHGSPAQPQTDLRH